ncbi:MAG: hypothetical protein RL329_260, partial [Bacteroidota bacterium]
MSHSLSIEPKLSRLIRLIELIEKGKVKIPAFQRDFIWSNKQKLELFDSIQLGYPIGTILLWKSEIDFKIHQEFGPYTVDTVSNAGFFYILDGFQRLSTLFGCLTNPEKVDYKIDESKLKREFNIYYDLEREVFNISRVAASEITNIPVCLLIDTYAFGERMDALRSKITDKNHLKRLIERGRVLSSNIIDYNISLIEIEGGTIQDAVEIFSRINSMGSKMSADWMTAALTHNEEDANPFNLGQSINQLLEALKIYNFGDLKRDVILQCIQNSYDKIYFDYKIEDLIKDKDKVKNQKKKTLFIEKTIQTVENIKRAIQFLFEELLVIDRRLLPYHNQLIFITYFFQENKQPSRAQLDKLKEWFWITTYSNYFTIYSLSKIRLAYNQFRDFVHGKTNNPVFNDKIKPSFVPNQDELFYGDPPDRRFETAPFPKTILLGSVRCCALLLFLLNHSNDFQPVDANEVDGLHLAYLFADSKDESDRFLSEGAIPMMHYVQNNPFKKSMD